MNKYNSFYKPLEDRKVIDAFIQQDLIYTVRAVFSTAITAMQNKS